MAKFVKKTLELLVGPEIEDGKVVRHLDAPVSLAAVPPAVTQTIPQEPSRPEFTKTQDYVAPGQRRAVSRRITPSSPVGGLAGQPLNASMTQPGGAPAPGFDRGVFASPVVPPTTPISQDPDPVASSKAADQSQHVASGAPHVQAGAAQPVVSDAERQQVSDLQAKLHETAHAANAAAEPGGDQQSPKPVEKVKTAQSRGEGQAAAPSKSASHKKGAAKKKGHTKSHKMQGLSALFGASAGRPLRGKSERELIQLESEIGATIFGPLPEGVVRREFFNLDPSTWIWHEELKDGTSSTIRYEIQPRGVLKVFDGAHYAYLEGQELDNFVIAAQTYYEKVAHDLYHSGEEDEESTAS